MQVFQRGFFLGFTSTIPKEITAGDTISWSASDADYLSSDGWTLSYVFINKDSKITADSTADGSGGYSVVISSTDSENFVPGRYSWSAIVTNGPERHTLASGSVDVLPDLSAQATYDQRSYVKKALDAIEALLLKKATKDQQAMIMPFGGRRIDRYPIDDLLKWRDRLMAEYHQERVANGEITRRKILTRFVG